MPTYYLEYKITHNRTGLLGDVASMLGLLNVNILTIASIENNYRGLLIEIDREEIFEILKESLPGINDLKVTAFRKPGLIDIIALRHGKKMTRRDSDNCFIFERENLDLLIDFLGEYLKRHNAALIGFKGSPKVGKTETAIAAAVHANKHWQLLSSTLLRKVARSQVSKDIMNKNTIFIIDSITTFYRSPSKHIKFIREIINKPLLRIVEHPEIIIKETSLTWEDFDLFIELHDGDNGTHKDISNYITTFNSFDLS
ncbi:DUF3388 domain-containing protein [Halothermothrix orenii]|uniref:Amino acid-binding ACT domain protein n=1 Tax=Halothermothrix orenii (strain H 168 / OCM 544 / DSM 9562) TaxID=373903 RepID=B8CWG8_HALOH|nr:DUF3388 domain-containing protein [Halothermothrix orenii]ACL69637.1 amino acid-binding ACT domain protein [Halothermothrix orenii H 168]